MNYKDVRIGNLVKYKGKIYRIAGISDTYPFLDTIEFGAGIVEWKDLEDVELTREVIERLNFKQVVRAVAFKLIFDGSFVLKLPDEFEIFGKPDDSFGLFLNNECIVTDLKYAHQIQNVVHSLLGIELEYHPTPE
jgi:hypothetical protein